MRILGVDPGTAIVGYSIVDYEKGKYEIKDYGCIYTHKDEDMPHRLEKIYNELETLIKLWKPNDMAIEELFFFKNQKTVIKVGQARGVIMVCGQKNNLDIFSYTCLCEHITKFSLTIPFKYILYYKLKENYYIKYI